MDIDAKVQVPTSSGRMSFVLKVRSVMSLYSNINYKNAVGYQSNQKPISGGGEVFEDNCWFDMKWN